MVTNQARARVLVGIITLISTMAYLYIYSVPIKDSVLFEWDRLSANNLNVDGYFYNDAEQNKYIYTNVYAKFSIPIIADITIPKTEIKIPVSISWYTYEIIVLALFLFFFLLGAPFLRCYKRVLPFICKLNHLISSILENKYLFIFLKDTLTIKADRFLFPALVVFYVLFLFGHFILHHHGAHPGTSNTQRVLFNLIMAIIPIAILFSVIPFATQIQSTNGRRKFLIQTSSIALFSISPFLPTATEKLFQSLIVKHIPRPRYKTKHAVLWHKIAVNPGLYRHSKSNNYYYVNDDNMIKSSSPIKAAHLIKVKSLALTEADFAYIPKHTASIFFENWALKLYKKGRILDALNCLEIGCKFEIYRIRTQQNNNPNIRLLKLYAGLCRRTNTKHKLSQLRKEIINDNLLGPLLQPPPQRWLFVRAFSFKQRWVHRKKYNGLPLTKA
jgi:hypothetical protein